MLTSGDTVLLPHFAGCCALTLCPSRRKLWPAPATARSLYALSHRHSASARDTEQVILSRGWSVFLVVVGVFNWAIWPRFALAIWDDARAWTGAVGHSSPTSFLLVHAVLVVTAVTLGTIVGILGIRGYLAARRLQPA